MTIKANEPGAPVQNISKIILSNTVNRLFKDGIENYMTDAGVEFWKWLTDEEKDAIEVKMKNLFYKQQKT